MKIKILTPHLDFQGMAEPFYKKVQKSKTGAQDSPVRAAHPFHTDGPNQQDNEDCMKQLCVRKVRLICTDPEATESSSDEEDEACNQRMLKKQGFLTKRIVREVPLPPNCCYVNVNSTGTTNFEGHGGPDCPLEAYDGHRSRIKKRRFSFGEKTPRLLTDRKAVQRCEDIGAKERSRGKWSAEFKDPACGIRHWLGTCSLAKAAAMTCASRHVLGSCAVTNFVSNAEAEEGEENVCCPSSCCRNKTRRFKEGHNASFKEDGSSALYSHRTSYLSRENDAWSMSSAVDDGSAELLPVCLDLDSMEECILSPQIQRKTYGCLLAASPSSVLEHDISEDCFSADKGSLDSVSDECGIETYSSLLGCVAANNGILLEASSSLPTSLAGQSSTLVRSYAASESFPMESKEHAEAPIAPLFLDVLSAFGEDFDGLFSLQSTSDTIDIPVSLQDSELFKEFTNCQGDLSGMDFELDSEALAWIDIPAM